MGRREEAVKLREAGLSCAEVGRQMGGLSKQRVSQILHPRPRKSKPPSDQMLRVSEVARLLGLHVNTVRRWSDAGKLPTFTISTRGDRRFKRSDVLKQLKPKEGSHGL